MFYSILFEVRIHLNILSRWVMHSQLFFYDLGQHYQDSGQRPLKTRNHHKSYVMLQSCFEQFKSLIFLKYIYFPPSPKCGTRIRKENNWSYGKKCHEIISLDCFQSFLIMINGFYKSSLDVKTYSQLISIWLLQW